MSSNGRFVKGDPRRHTLTTEERSRGGKKSRHNLVPMRRGFDRRRHQFTEEQLRAAGEKGFRAVMEKRPECLLWLKKKLRSQGRRGKRTAAA